MRRIRAWTVDCTSEADVHESRSVFVATYSLQPTVTAAVLIVALLLSGCSNIEPWVKPYDRAALADPIMAGSRAPVADEYFQHVNEVREGARGGTGSAGGGCGCN